MQFLVLIRITFQWWKVGLVVVALCQAFFAIDFFRKALIGDWDEYRPRAQSLLFAIVALGLSLLSFYLAFFGDAADFFR